MYSIEELANNFRKLGACAGDAVMLHVAAVETAGAAVRTARESVAVALRAVI
jgi:hypothetical protein